jgi:hypothetical protein
LYALKKETDGGKVYMRKVLLLSGIFSFLSLLKILATRESMLKILAARESEKKLDPVPSEDAVSDKSENKDNSLDAKKRKKERKRKKR